jgi:hypothetical protein
MVLLVIVVVSISEGQIILPIYVILLPGTVWTRILFWKQSREDYVFI